MILVILTVPIGLIVKAFTECVKCCENGQQQNDEGPKVGKGTVAPAYGTV